MKHLHYIYCVLIIIAMFLSTGCINSGQYKGIPQSAVVKTESNEYVIFSDSIGCDSLGRTQSEVWLWDKKQQTESKWGGYISCRIDRATIISVSPLIVFTEEYYNPGYNCSIINTEKDSLISFSCDEGLLCTTPDEGLIVVGNKGFYGFGGTYTILVVMNHEGKVIQEIPLKAKTDVPIDIEREWEEKYPNAKISDFQRVVENHPGADEDEIRRFGDIELGAYKKNTRP